MSTLDEGGNGGETTTPSVGSGDGGGGMSQSAKAAAAITGFLVCSLLLAVVIALIIYNVYLWRRRKNEGRRSRQRLVRQPSPRWKAYQEANGIGGAGVNKPRRGRDNLGYAPSSGSVDIKGSGPPPTATLDDINLSDDEDGNSSGELKARYTKNHNPGNFPMTATRPHDNDELHNQNGYWNNGNDRERVQIYPTTRRYRNPGMDDPEIQLRPGQLEPNLRQAPPLESPGKDALENHYLYSNNNNRGPPPYDSVSQGNPSKPPRPMIQRNSGLALLSSTGSPMAPGTVSLTGMGALECPGLDFGPTTVSHSGSMGYNDY